MNERVAQLVAQLSERELDALLVSNPENRRYLSGFTGSAGYLLVTPQRQILFTDSRYTEQAGSQCRHFEVVQMKAGLNWLLDALKDTGVRRVGFESDNMTVAFYNRALEAIKEEAGLLGTSLIATAGITAELRVLKDKVELAQLQKAIDASDQAMEMVCPAIEAGMTEKEVAWRMEAAMREFGGQQRQLQHHRGRRSQRSHGAPPAQRHGYPGRGTHCHRHGSPGWRLLQRHHSNRGGGQTRRNVP